MSFLLYADKNRLYRRDWEAVTSGSVNVYAVRYQFSTDWECMTKTAVFKAEGMSVKVPLDEGNGYIIPWEVLTKHGVKLYAGIYGTRGSDKILPTIWAFLSEVLEGAEPNTGNTVNPPSGGGAGVPGPQGPPGPPGADVSNWQTYSTREQAIGTWINGRTLYRKCYAELTSPATEGQKNDFLYVKDLGIKTLVRHAHWGRAETRPLYNC